MSKGTNPRWGRESDLNQRIRNNIGLALLAVWLILTGLMGLGLDFPQLSIVAAILAVAAGVLLLLGR